MSLAKRASNNAQERYLILLDLQNTLENGYWNNKQIQDKKKITKVVVVKKSFYVVKINVLNKDSKIHSFL
jgi:hypothetical protein